MSGFGAAAWGTSGFGGLPSTLGVASAFATSTHEISVTLTKPPRDLSPFAPGDVRNPAAWVVMVPATGAELEVTGITAAERPLRWVVRTAQPLPDSSTLVVVSAPGLVDPAGNALVDPPSASLLGVTELATSTPQRLVDTRLRAGADLANLPTPAIAGTSVGGTLVIVGGDYALVSGPDLLRKLILRRLTAIPGDFFHLPNYGVGLAVKQPLPASGISRLQKKVEQQVLLEPDVKSVTVALTQAADSINVNVKVVVASTGQSVSVALNSPIG